MAKNKQTGCSSCGRTDLMLVAFVHEKTRATHHLCILCGDKAADAPQKRSIASYDEELADYKDMAEQFKRILGSMPQSDKFEGLEGFAVTPLSAFRSVQFKIAQLESERAAALIAEGGEFYLNVQLENALAAEDFEKAAAIRNQLAELKK